MGILTKRQDELDRIITDALKDPILLEAMKAFKIGQHEYCRAISGLKAVKIYSSNTSDPGDKQNGTVVKH